MLTSHPFALDFIACAILLIGTSIAAYLLAVVERRERRAKSRRFVRTVARSVETPRPRRAGLRVMERATETPLKSKGVA